MDAKYFIVNQGCKREVVENICAVFPDVKRPILPQAFIIETINLGDLS
jgi:hypothetical protein